jgi:adenosylmethionine-8-amino-7-oxononanoate aminotransferase
VQLVPFCPFFLLLTIDSISLSIALLSIGEWNYLGASLTLFKGVVYTLGIMSSIWYPYTQHQTMDVPWKVTHADGVYLHLDDGSILIDGVSSWWSMIHGYNHPELNQALTDQLSKVAHVMLGGLTHDSVEKLADCLVKITPSGLNHVFFSDSGSVGCEVAMKMALQYHINHGQLTKKQFIALYRGYHGDTLGVMSLGTDDDAMHALFKESVFPQHFVDPGNLDQLQQCLEDHHQTIAAMIVEPLLQGAGGFLLHSPDYLDHAKQLCERYDVLMIFDEVATGFGRTGTLFAADQCAFTPDIMVLGKALTGGYMGHAATLATDRVFNAFYSPYDHKAFMHGPTFMGNPLACAVALKSIDVFLQEDYLSKIARIETQLRDSLFPCRSFSCVSDSRVKGGMGVIEMVDRAQLKGFQQFAKERGVWLRPFDRYLYTMPPYIINESDLLKITDCMVSWCHQWS